MVPMTERPDFSLACLFIDTLSLLREYWKYDKFMCILKWENLEFYHAILHNGSKALK